MDSTTSPSTTPNFARAVGRNTIIQFVGKIIGTILGFATFSIALRYLHPDGIGSYTTAMAYLGFFSVVADLGLYLILVRDLNKPNANVERVIGNLLALRWLSAGIILLASAALVFLFPFTPAEKVAVLIGAVSFIAVAGTQLLVGAFQSKMAMIHVTTAELIGRAVLLLAIMWVVRVQGSLSAVMVAVVAGSVINFLIIWFSARKFFRIRLCFDWPYWQTTLRDTWPIAISIVLNLIYFRADTIILRMMKGTYDVGLYGAAYRILEILNTFPLIFVGLLLPALGAAFSRTDNQTFQRIFQRGFDLLLMAIGLLLVAGWLLAEPMMVAMGGSDYAPAAPVFRLLLIAVSALYLGSLSGHVVTIIHRQRQMVWSYLSVAVIGLIAYLTLIPRYSLYGAAMGTIITEAITALVGYILILRVMKFRLQVSIIPRVLIASGLMAAVILLLRSTSWWLALMVGSLIYVVGLILTRALSIGTIREILSSRTKNEPDVPTNQPTV